MDSPLDIPRPVLYVGGAILAVFVVLGLRKPRPMSSPGQARLDATIASIGMTAASNIQAAEIASGRDVALAETYTRRYQSANQLLTDREAMALAFMADRGRNRTRIESERMEHAVTLDQAAKDFEIIKTAQRQAKIQADREFKLAKRNFPKIFELELAALNAEREAVRYQYDIQTRRLDLMQFGAQAGPQAIGGYVDAAGRLISQGIGAYNAITGGGGSGAIAGGGSSGGGSATGALSGAASGAALGTAIYPGIGTAVGAAAGAAGGGSGGS